MRLAQLAGAAYCSPAALEAVNHTPQLTSDMKRSVVHLVINLSSMFTDSSGALDIHIVWTNRNMASCTHIDITWRPRTCECQAWTCGSKCLSSVSKPVQVGHQSYLQGIFRHVSKRLDARFVKVRRPKPLWLDGRPGVWESLKTIWCRILIGCQGDALISFEGTKSYLSMVQAGTLR